MTDIESRKIMDFKPWGTVCKSTVIPRLDRGIQVVRAPSYRGLTAVSRILNKTIRFFCGDTSVQGDNIQRNKNNLETLW
jgi:hypothetical protein